MDKIKISVYTILYYDLQFYENIIYNLYDVIDEFIIVDGPYSYAVDILKKFNLFYDETNKPLELNNLINKYPKIKYKYIISNNEEEKRIIGYNMCSNNYVALVDTDEFLTIDFEKFNEFVDMEDKFVSCSNIYNMCSYNISINNITEKYIFFKKDKISAEDHLDYTWLIGCNQKEKNVSYMNFNPCGLIYHQTLNRNKKNNIIKFIFYALLYEKNKNYSSLNLIDEYDNDTLLKYLTVDEILNIFIHSHNHRINIPDDNSKFNIIEDNKMIIQLKKYENNLIEFELNEKTKCLKNLASYFRLNKNKKKYNFIIDNVLNLSLNIYYVYKDYNDSKSFVFNNLSNNIIDIPNESTNEVLFIFIKLKCDETINGEIIYSIENS